MTTEAIERELRELMLAPGDIGLFNLEVKAVEHLPALLDELARLRADNKLKTEALWRAKKVMHSLRLDKHDIAYVRHMYGQVCVAIGIQYPGHKNMKISTFSIRLCDDCLKRNTRT